MSAVLDCGKVFFYYEPGFFLFVGKLGSFKCKVSSYIYCKFLTGILRLGQSILSIMLFVYRSNYENIFSNYFSLTGRFGFLMNYVGSSIYHAKTVARSKFFSSIVPNVVSSIVRGWNKRLRFVGIGYKVYSFCNLLVFKLGYSHYVIYLLPYELRLSFIGRKKRNLVLFGIDRVLLSVICSCIMSLRVPNVYTGKGIRLRGATSFRKEGKKSQF